MHTVEASVTATAARVAVAGRVAVVVGCTALVPIGGAPQGSAVVVVAALAWQAVFLRGRHRRPAVALDTAVLAAALVLLPWLRPEHGHLRLDDWAGQVSSVVVGAAQFYTRWRAGAAVALVTAAAVLTGSLFATADEWNLRGEHAGTLLWQAVLARCLIVLLSRGARRVDELTGEVCESRRTARLAAGRRAGVEEHLAALHDTVAVTLTAASAHAVLGPELRRRARSDLSRLAPAPAGPGTPPAAADLRTLPVVGALRITTVLPDGLDVAVPPHAVAALVAARDEALRNVERHAGTDRARVELRASAPGSVELDVVDDGGGFRPSDVPDGHFGVRLSIEARMRRAGGSARVVSAPGCGTRVELRWPA